MIAQVYLPTAQKFNQFELQMAQHDLRTREALDKSHQQFRDEIAQAETKLDRLLTDGYNIRSTAVLEDSRGGFIHYLLWKPDGDDDTEEARIPDMDEATFDEGFAAAEAIHQENYPDDERAYL